MKQLTNDVFTCYYISRTFLLGGLFRSVRFVARLLLHAQEPNILFTNYLDVLSR